MNHNVVIISAHPDDMEIGMGGTVAKLVESMAVITSVVVTNGGQSSNPFALTEQRMVEVRREEALRAAGVLGVKDVIFCDEPDTADEINTTAVKRRPLCANISRTLCLSSIRVAGGEKHPS
jgi:LmbE family N-acetylglucosaminyl deacetylase